MATSTLQLTNNEVIVWSDLATNAKRSTLRFEYDDTQGAYLAVGRGNNADPIRLTNVGTPVSLSDATTKQYVDNMIQGLVIKEPVRVVAITNVTLSTLMAGSIIDGVTLLSGDRVLLAGQTNGVENGIWVLASGSAPQRSADMHAGLTATGVYVFADEGVEYKDRSYVCITNRTDASGALTSVVGTNTLEWVQFSARSSAMAGRGLVTGVGEQLDVNVDNVTLEVNAGDQVTIKNPNVNIKVERGLLRCTSDGVSVVSTAVTDSAAANVLGQQVNLGGNIAIQPDFTVLPDLAASNA